MTYGSLCDVCLSTYYRMTLDGGANDLCLPIALNSELLEKNPDNTFNYFNDAEHNVQLCQTT